MEPINRRERGSAMVMALFVLFLLASTGTALLFLSNSEVKMSQASVRTTEVFYLAEAAIEAGRSAFYQANILDSFDDDLLAAAGADTSISILPDQIEPVFDANGVLTGLTGVGDDAPLVAIQNVPGGSIAAFLMNDPLDGRTNKTDTNPSSLRPRSRCWASLRSFIARHPR
jgi:Tfp pilus assembly protein PilX